MLASYCSDDVEFTARSEVGIGPSGAWMNAQVSISKVFGDTCCLLVQTKSDTNVKILYSDMISKRVKLALDEKSLVVSFYHPRTAPKEVNEYKLRFTNHVDFWNCLTTYVKARIAGSKPNVQRDATTSVLVKSSEDADPKEPMETGPEGKGVEPAGQAVVTQPGVAGPMFAAADFPWLA